MADGSRHSLFAIAESVYGTTPATPAWDTMRITSCSLGLSRDSLQSEENRSDRQIAVFRGGANQVQGDIGFELSYGTLDSLLEAALFGAWDSDTPALGTDQLKVGVTRKSFSFLRHFADLAAGKPYLLFTGCEVSSLSLSIAANAMVTGTLSVLGQAMTVSATAPASSTYIDPTETDPVDSFTGALLEGGVSIAVITEVQLTLENGLESRYVVGSRDSIRPSVGRSNVNGTITAYFENTTLLEKFLDETESSIQLDLPDADGNNLRIVIPRIKYTGAPPDVSGEGPITLALPFQALLDETEETNLIIERTAA